MYLNSKSTTPPIPFELMGHISADDWDMRVPALTKLASRYYKPLFERIWLAVSILITLIVPLVVYPSIDRAIFGKDESKGSKAFAARVVSVLIFLAVVLMMWMPIFIWKRIGTRRVRLLLASYATADESRVPRPPFIPKWTMSTPGIINMDIALHISTPPVAPVTLFHPDAYLPAFIGKVEERGAYFYPYPTTLPEAGLPRMSTVGPNYVFEKV